MKRIKSAVKMQIIAAVMLNAVQVILCLLCNNFGLPILFMLATNLSYRAWTESKEGYTPWAAFLGFTTAGGVQFMLNAAEIIPPDGNVLGSGMGQFFYCAGLLLSAVIFGISNFVRWLRFLDRQSYRQD